MVRLNLEGIWIDLTDQEFELKWKHPIQNSLKGESSTYSTDISASLTENNRIASDYNIFLESVKTNKYIYGALYMNGTMLRVRCYIKEFSPTYIKFYLEQFLSGGVSSMIKDTTNICDLFLPEIQNQTKRDVLLSLTNQTAARSPYLYVPGTTLNDIFNWDVPTSYVDSNGTAQIRPNIYADERLLQKLADFYGFTLNNAPENYWVYCNQFKCRTNTLVQVPVKHENHPGSGGDIIDFGISTPLHNIYIVNQIITSASPIKLFVKISNTVSTGTFIFYSNNTVGGVGAQIEFGRISANGTDILFQSDELPAGSYYISVTHNVSCSFDIGLEAEICYTAEEKADSTFKDYANFELEGLYPCWQNLPAVTAKQIIETIALCSGKLVSYEDNVVNFIDFDKVFDWQNAIVSIICLAVTAGKFCQQG